MFLIFKFSHSFPFFLHVHTNCTWHRTSVSYTHLDVYKRQVGSFPIMVAAVRTQRYLGRGAIPTRGVKLRSLYSISPCMGRNCVYVHIVQTTLWCRRCIFSLVILNFPHSVLPLISFLVPYCILGGIVNLV